MSRRPAQADSANGVQLLRSGDYDGGAFGNATDRLMAAGDVAPINGPAHELRQRVRGPEEASHITRKTAFRTACRTAAVRTS